MLLLLFLLKHNWLTILYHFQVYSIVIQFFIDYTINICYTIIAGYFLELHNKLCCWLAAHTAICVSQSPTPVFSLLSSLSPLISSLWVCFIFLIFTSVFYFLDFTYKWGNTAFIFVRLTRFSYNNTLQVHPCCCKWQYFIIYVLVVC